MRTSQNLSLFFPISSNPHRIRITEQDLSEVGKYFHVVLDSEARPA
jgi:hypothetical protein